MAAWFQLLNDYVSAQLGAQAGPGAWLFLLLGGVLASLLPCVYPLYPITITILRGRRSALGSAAHPLAYYAGLSLTYAAFGVIAALSGGAFNTVIRTPAFNLGVGLLMVTLAAAIVGWVEFPVLTAGGRGAAARDGDQGLFGTAMMGAGAGLLSSACVGPVVVSILVGLVAHSDALAAGTVALAAAKMFAFGLGVGLPLVLIGVFGLALPRAGAWMMTVQWVFAALLLFFAYGYLAKGLAGLGLDGPATDATVAGGALLLAASYFHQGPERAAHERGRAALATLAGACGLLMMIRMVAPGAAGASAAGASAADASGPAGRTQEEEHGLVWWLDRELAYAEAARTGKPVFIDFYGSWCTNCKSFAALVGSDEQLRAALGQAVLLKVYDTSPLFREYRADPRLPELSVGLPFFLITDARGEILYKTADYLATAEMRLFLEG